MRFFILLISGCTFTIGFAQFSFSGYIRPENDNHTVYLSLVEDYRKLEGIYTEQIIATTKADSLGFFEFKGNRLDDNNRIYRIHTDDCPTDQLHFNHFNGYCGDSETLLFIANNNDTLNLPFSFGNQIFCKIESNNLKANAFFKIDSLKNDMRFAYSEFRSKANQKLNDKKWFKTLQTYGESLDEPLAELHIYAYLSDRKHHFHSYYAEDLKKNGYYNDLKVRLQKKYPNTIYSKQYQRELEADQYMISSNDSKTSWTPYLLVVLGCSLALNVWLFVKSKHLQRKKVVDLTEKLSKQERIVLDQMLQNKSNKAIAESLFLSVSTVKSHINNIYKKLEVQSRDDLKTLFNK